MTQHIHDEKVALVEKAKGILNKYFSHSECDDESCWRGEETCFTHRLVEAHQSFFKRHEDNGEGGCSYYGCSNPCHDYTGLGCEVPSICNKPDSYPCPESVTTAEIIVNGVPE